MFLCAAGCASGTSIFRIVDYRGPGAVKHYRERFDEAYYTFDGAGNVDIVLRRSSPSEAVPDETISQTVHIHGIWRSIPGRTVAHRTQINAIVRYAIVSGGYSQLFEGAGSVFFSRARWKDALTGQVEQATLQPVGGAGNPEDLFKEATMSGSFYAVPDPRKTVRLVNQLQQNLQRKTGA